MKSLAIVLFMGVLSTMIAAPAMASFDVSAQAETPAFGSSESADDPTIWLHPTDPSLSLIIGTNKDTGDPQWGLHVYDVAGNPVDSYTGSKQNNVDVRYGFPLGDRRVDLLASTNRTDDTIDFFTIDADTRSLSFISSIPSGFADPYGVALFNDRQNDKFYVFISDDDNDGSIRQFELDGTGGTISGQLRRSWNVGSLTEGLAVDDSHGSLFAGEEDVGIWRYDANPTAGTGTNDRVAVGQGTNEVKAGDVEGVNVFQIGGANNERGYLLASEQGDNSFAILERYDQDGDGNLYEFLGRFEIVTGGGIDGVSDTDGIGVISSGLGAAFPEGLLVAQDGSNNTGGQNYKLVSWSDIVAAAAGDVPSLELATDPGFDPRGRLVWDGPTAEWGGQQWNNGFELVDPNGGENMVVVSGLVDVEQDYTGIASPLSLAVEGGTVRVGTSGELEVSGRVITAEGSTLIVDGVLLAYDGITIGGVVAGSGTIVSDSVVISGVLSPGDFPVTVLSFEEYARSVPEPSTVVLLITAALGLLAFAWHR